MKQEDDTAQRLQDLAERYALAPADVGALASLLDMLARDMHAPSSVRVPAQAVDVHIADSLAALELGLLSGAETVVDVGSGAGFPGLALAAARRQTRFTLLESQERKCAYIERARAEAQIENARAVWARAESWEDGRAGADAVLARALAAQAVVLEYAAPLLSEGGVVIDWRGRRDAAAEAAADRAAEELGLRRIETRAVTPFRSAEARHLHVFAKVSPTPERFPRRPGLAAKRPLGGA